MLHYISFSWLLHLTLFSVLEGGSQCQKANLVRWACITACDLWEASPQTEVLAADTGREEEQDVINKLLLSLPELGLGGSQKLLHIQISYWLCGDAILPLGKQQLLAPAEFLPASSTTDLEKKNTIWHIILGKLLTLVSEGWEGTILNVHTVLFSISSNSLSTALKKIKKRKSGLETESSVSFLCVTSPFYRWLDSSMSGVNVMIV